MRGTRTVDPEWHGPADGAEAVEYRAGPDFEELYFQWYLGDCEGDWPNPRKLAPFQPGDIVWMEDFAEIHPVLVRVIGVFVHRFKHRNYSIPKYRVQRITRGDQWSKRWEYTFPGPIFRGYHPQSTEESE